ncbi:hypothetical protein DENSPDRAFT_856893 [Dentipellis sp. KUC8613]|nr:hypothetical protein DENSPDRAFT_856893 [Dentipellis sp. KUC8613]
MPVDDVPPPPLQDFDFGFDPALNIFPSPPPLPPSSGLFSPSETTDLFGFLDNFNWEFDTDGANINDFSSLPAPNDKPLSHPLPHDLKSSPHPYSSQPQKTHSPIQIDTHVPPAPQPPTGSHSHSKSLTPTSSSPTPTAPGSRKTLLSSPQKRLNHIMSEQKRRNAIREGYAQLTTLLAPAGAPPGSGMPTRGRPKGSGSRSKGRTKGKSGVLFRAVEYCHWLEEGIEALREEVLRVEAAAGIRA